MEFDQLFEEEALARVNKRQFQKVLTIVNALGIGLVIFVTLWAFSYGDQSAINPALSGLLGIHMVFMVLFMLFLHALTSLAYRVLPKEKKATINFIHGGFHFIICIGASVGLAAAVTIHNNSTPAQHASSLHSWLGIVALLLYYLEFSGGFLVLLQLSLEKYQLLGMKAHKICGLLILLFACSAVVSGLFNVSRFSLEPAGGLTTSGVILNIAALLTVSFTFTVAYGLTEERFRWTVSDVQPFMIPTPSNRKYGAVSGPTLKNEALQCNDE